MSAWDNDELKKNKGVSDMWGKISHTVSGEELGLGLSIIHQSMMSGLLASYAS